MASTTTAFPMDFDHTKSSSFIDMDSSNLINYLDTSSMEYFQASPPEPPYMTLPSQESPYLASISADYYDRSFTPGEGVSPPMLSYTLSAGELSSDGMASGRRSRGSNSPVPFAATVPRSVRYNPVPPAAVRSSARAAHKRKMSRSNDESDDEDEEFQPPPAVAGAGTDARRESIRRQRIESEQRRRDELREGYNRLKVALPVTTQRTSKVSLLDRATTYITEVKKANTDLEKRLQAAETEVHRLRNVNEALMLGTAQRHAVAPGF